MEHLLVQKSKKSSISLENTMFSERDFRLAQYQVFPRRELRKWKVRIAFRKHCVFQCKWSILGPKVEKVLHFHWKTQCFQSALLTFPFLEFPGWKTWYSACRKSRSENVAKSNKIGALFGHLGQRVLHLHWKTQCFQNSNLTFHFLEFHHGKT